MTMKKANFERSKNDSLKKGPNVNIKFRLTRDQYCGTFRRFIPPFSTGPTSFYGNRVSNNLETDKTN